MKSFKLLIITLLLCLFFPISSNADPMADVNTAISNKDFTKAVELLNPLADQNNLEAKKTLGALYFKGQGVERNINKGLALIMDAADQGNKNAKVLAAALNKELAQMGDEKAMYNMGYMCLKGWGGTTSDPNKCVEWLDLAASKGHIKSAKVLSSIYAKGSYGVTADKDKATFYDNLAKNPPAPAALP